MSDYIIVGFDEENMTVLKRQVLIAFLEDKQWLGWKRSEGEKQFENRILYELDHSFDMDGEFEKNHGSGIADVFGEYAKWFTSEYYHHPERRSKMDEKLSLLCKRLNCRASPIMDVWEAIHVNLDFFIEHQTEKNRNTFGCIDFIHGWESQNLFKQFGEAFEDNISQKYVLLAHCTELEYTPYMLVEDINRLDYDEEKHRSAW